VILEREDLRHRSLAPRRQGNERRLKVHGIGTRLEEALGEDDAALAHLEMYVLRPAPHQAEPYTLRDLYLANDWDRLRGQPRFESLFKGVWAY